MHRRVWLSLSVTLLLCHCAFGRWLEIDNLKIRQDPTELGGPRTFIEYDINEPGLSPMSPAYVFIRYSPNAGETWHLLPNAVLRGNGHDLVSRAGHKEVVWWGTDQTSFVDLDMVEIRVRAMAMVQVPAGKFAMKSLPGGGRDESGAARPDSDVPLFYMARYETTLAMYADYLNEVGGDGMGWNPRMSHADRCGITQNSNRTYSVEPGRGDYPVTYVSWYDAAAFLQWCGLRLPTEAQWEKALRGGFYLDGDKTGQRPNPMPERSYPWGDEAPDSEGVWRCNCDTEADGFAYTAPVGSFSQFNSPYGICDLAGNVAEWTLDWYTTSHHAGLDGFRVVRGGSWMAVPVACDAITGATQLPLKESSIMGFRGVKVP
jgi:formylglycine-generating enzyme required for sulfatase activity